MSYLRVVRPWYESPPGPLNQGYQFTHPENGFTTTGRDRDTWWSEIVKFRRNNGLPITETLRAEAEDQFCKLLPPGWCKYDDGSDPKLFIEARLSINDIWNGTKVLGEFVAQGLPLVEQSVAEARAATCATCPFNVPVSGCAPCVGLSALVDSAAPGKTRADEQLSLKACAICKCSSRAQVWLPVDILSVGVTDYQMERWPEWCWKGNEVRAFRLTSEKK